MHAAISSLRCQPRPQRRRRAPDGRADRRPRRPAPLHRLGDRDRRALHRGGPARAARPGRAGRVPLHARGAPRDVPQADVDDAPVRRLRLGQGVQRALPLPALEGLDRPVDGLRPAHAARPGLRQPALPRRGRAHRRGDRHDRRHAHRLRRHPARPGVHVDDDQRARRVPAAALRAGRRGAGRAQREAARHHPERRAQGVHRARQLHLPARARRCA